MKIVITIEVNSDGISAEMIKDCGITDNYISDVLHCLFDKQFYRPQTEISKPRIFPKYSRSTVLNLGFKQELKQVVVQEKPLGNQRTIAKFKRWKEKQKRDTQKRQGQIYLDLLKKKRIEAKIQKEEIIMPSETIERYMII